MLWLHQRPGAAMKCPAPGIHGDVPASVYHSWDCISQSQLKDVLDSPADYIHRSRHKRQQTDAMALGEAVHTLTLEPDNEGSIVICGTKTRRGKAFQELQDDNPGACIVTEAQMETAREMRDAIMADDTARRMLDGDREVSLRWDAGLVNCKARLDVVRARAIVDVKTGRDISPQTFQRDAFRKWRYHMQAAWYREAAAQAIGGPVRDFYLVCVQSAPPHHVKVYSIGERAIAVGESLCKRALKTYQDCAAAGKWPGYGGGIQLLEISDWTAEEHTRQADEEVSVNDF